LPRATRAAAALEEKLGIKPELKEGAPGSFEVSVDDEVVSARKFWGFPSEKDIVSAVASALGLAVPA
jgi:hypothetical protein